jgi:Polyketide cyclase / dehydrase and lipid transport
MAHWTAHTTSQAAPEQVLEVLTDPDAIRSWSPVPFELDELEGDRLAAGDTARVNGNLAGLRVGFDVEVHAAGADGLDLTAHGPIALDVSYALAPTKTGSQVTASVAVRDGRGLTGRLVAKATGALLSAGALDGAAGRIARAAEAAPALAA